jgi:molybdenum cofactor cytidylyltransferase/nicotine blue oxidoreductase
LVLTSGLLLAAGAGRRMGGPKALLRDAGGVPFLDRAVGVLLEGGCESVTVVLGAGAEQARALLDSGPWADAPVLSVVEARDWDEGMGASLRTGLDALASATRASAALVTLVDLPDVGADVVRRVLEAGTGPAALVRATYDGHPGHPVLIGRDHWPGVRVSAHGDQGARTYFRDHPPAACECGDLASGRDVDRPADLTP